jgi:signal transduction histidine kinase
MIGIEVSELLATTDHNEQPKPSNHFLADYCTSQQPIVAAIGRAADRSNLTLELSASYGEVDDDVLITWVVRDVGYIDAIQRQSNLSQRLEGIGELAAGIAHEINTPIQFVIENTKFFGDAYHVINQVLGVYEHHAGENAQLKEAVGAICPPDQLKFYRGEVATAIEETKAGASRIGEIVAAIKEFAHPGTEASTSVNLNDLVATAVTVTSNNCKYVANVDRLLDTTLPTVSCLRGQITQVMVNLIVNAADAIIEKNQTSGEATGTITIETGHDDEYVFFSVSDTGTGIDMDNLDNIFLPFFTTKDVGKGTGQGLAITHAIIVENHNGKIDIESEAGQGSKFIVRLPRG